MLSFNYLILLHISKKYIFFPLLLAVVSGQWTGSIHIVTPATSMGTSRRQGLLALPWKPIHFNQFITGDCRIRKNKIDNIINIYIIKIYYLCRHLWIQCPLEDNPQTPTVARFKMLPLSMEEMQFSPKGKYRARRVNKYGAFSHVKQIHPVNVSISLILNWQLCLSVKLTWLYSYTVIYPCFYHQTWVHSCF